jgi:hypothetical protein
MSAPQIVVQHCSGINSAKIPTFSVHNGALYEYNFFFFLWLYSPILGLGCLHETFRFISVTRSRTVGRMPWTGDQLVARPLLAAPGDCDDGEVDGMNSFGRGYRSTQTKPALTTLCPPQIPLARPGREPRPPWWEAGD